MKLINTILPIAALTTAFVLPDEQQFPEQVALKFEQLKDNAKGIWSKASDIAEFSRNAIDSAIGSAFGDAKDVTAASFKCYESMTRFETQEWLDSDLNDVEEFDVDDEDKPDHPHPPHHGKPPHHGPPHRGHGHRPHHKPNQTLYELISNSNYTTKLAKLINEFPDLVKTLNGTSANYTLFAPIDAAFEKIPKHHKKPSKEILEKILSYHVSSGFYPAGRVLASHTIPTAYKEKGLGGQPQRLRISVGLKGVAVNFYSRVIAVNIFGTNGVIHGVNSILLPPPPALKIISFLPGEFSTLQLGLTKTGLLKELTEAHHEGGTLFAPSNFAFKRLGPRINAFLFSKPGEKYLRALLEYHVVANQTLYSDAFVKGDKTVELPRGHFHVDLPTLLKDKSLSIDVARWGRFITLKINGFGGVAVQDGIAQDGVIHVVARVLIPPRTAAGGGRSGPEEEVVEVEEEEELDLEDFKDRLIPFIPVQEL